uniref:DUF4042 domain-containing protein n=1 Tax=Strongyloides papillosus TaxID=174720 RepID=A0A0N5BFI6_STREA
MVRTEILNAITKIILGLGNTSTSIHKDTYKSIAVVNCLYALVKNYTTLHTMDIDDNNGNGKLWNIESSFNLLSDVSIRGGIGGFLKSTVARTNISSYSSFNEIGFDITLAYIKIIKTMG